MKRIYILTILLAGMMNMLAPVVCQAHISVRSRFLSSENGLKADYIRGITQDGKGYIWMGATTGLIRYDGYTTELITPDGSDSRRLMLDERIQAIDIWQGRFVWMMVRGQKYCCYDTETSQFVDYTGNGSYEESYRHYHILRDGTIWLSDRKKGCKVIRYDGKTFSSRKEPLERLPEEAHPQLPEQHAALMAPGRDLITDNRGNLIVTSLEGELWYIARNSRQPIHLSGIYNKELLRLNGSPRYSVVTDKDGVIWITAYGNGLFAHDPKSGVTTHFSNNGSQIAPVQTNYLQRLFEDKAGNIWVCQENMGVSIISKQSTGIRSLYLTTRERTDHTNSIHLLTRINDQIYIGNRYNGLMIADGQLELLKDASMVSDDVIAACTDRQGNIWTGTRENGIFANQLNLRHHPGQPQSLAAGKISDIVCDKEGRIWISIFDGGLELAVSDGQGGYTFSHFFTGKDAITHPRKMTVDHDGYIWLCSDEGLYTFKPEQLIAKPASYRHLDIGQQSNTTNEAHCITETRQHHIVVGTAGNGIAVFDNSQAGNAHLLRQYTKADGMPNNNVQQVMEDDMGYLWAGTDHGLARLNPETGSIMNLLPATTLQGNMFIENAACRLTDGRLAFGSRHGITVVDPKAVATVKPLFQLRVTDININGIGILEAGKEDLSALLGNGGELTLSHNENSLEFHFSDFEYNEGHTPKFTYRLRGYDREWSPMSDYNFAAYKNLPPGNYVMEVRAQNDYGDWNENTISLPVTIRPPFWATWWAYLIYLLLTAGVTFLIYRQLRRVNALRNRIKVEQQLTEYKMQFFTNISHEFRTPLTIIRGAADRLRTIDKMPADMKQPVFSMQKSAERLMRMVNQLLEFSKMHENKLKLAVEETEVVGFLRDIFSTFKDMAETKRISYLFTTNVKELTILTDRSYLDKIAYNLISNAFKYTPSHHDVTVRVKQDEGYVRLIVEDTGIGIEKEKQKELFERFNQSVFSRDSIGIGLHLTNELVRVHHGTIIYEENPKGGSIFTVSLPTDRNAYSQEELMKTDNAIAIEEEQANSSIGEDYKEMPPVPINKRDILIVEDDSDVREYLQRELMRYFVVDSANDGQEAIGKISQTKPELIVTDAIMPVMDGFELIRRIRKNTEWNDIPIVMLTALSNEADNLKGLKAGADAYIRKPFSLNVLIVSISKLMEQRDKLRISYAKAVVGTAVVPEVLINESDRRLKEQMALWMETHLNDTQVTAESFAQDMGFGRTAFFKKMKQLTGMTPNDYIKKARMEAAAELLVSTNLTAAEIAYKTGFEDQYYFSRSFKKYFGTPPSKYRRGEPAEEAAQGTDTCAAEKESIQIPH